MKIKTVLITGGTGLVGAALAKHLAYNGYEVIVFTRNVSKANYQHFSFSQIKYAQWSVTEQWVDEEAFASADAIIHLAGAGVMDAPWTEQYRMEIINSRINSSKLIVETLKKLPNKVRLIISTSAIGYYGSDKNSMPFTETNKPVRTFLGETCRLWEESIKPVSGLQTKLIINRIGIVLSPFGGALAAFMKPLKLCRVGAIPGSGKQVVSWIHIDDLCRLFQYQLENVLIKNVFNAVAPNPVSTKTLIVSLGKALYGKWFIKIPTPTFVIKLILGKRSIEVLKSTNVSADLIMDEGFQFTYPEINLALQNIVNL